MYMDLSELAATAVVMFILGTIFGLFLANKNGK